MADEKTGVRKFFSRQSPVITGPANFYKTNKAKIDDKVDNTKRHNLVYIGAAAFLALSAAVGVYANKSVNEAELKQAVQEYSVPGPQGPAGAAGIAGAAGENYVLTDENKQEIADIVAKDYVAPTPAPTPTPAPAPVPTPTPTPTPAPYAPPQMFVVSYDNFKSFVAEDIEGLSEASGIGKETLTDLVDGKKGSLVRNGKRTYDPELVKVAIDTVADTAKFEFKSGTSTKYATRPASALVEYLLENTLPEDRADVFQEISK